METTSLNMAVSTASAIFQIIFYSLQWTVFTGVHLTLSLIHLAAWPLAALWTVLLFVCAPVIYTIRSVYRSHQKEAGGGGAI